jgi:sulfonate transport system substrate-binding protein
MLSKMSYPPVLRQENNSMKSSNLKRLIPVLLILLSVGAFAVCNRRPSDVPKPLRLGWQPPWANQGQIVEVFKNSDVLRRNGVTVDFKAFTYGGPMTEAALAGEVDVLFVGNQPAITLISRDSDWQIIGRMVNYRSAIIVPPGSPLKSLSDLAGRKVVATAFGSTTHRDAVQRLTEVGLDTGKDVNFVNLDQAEHAALIARGGSQRWLDTDAIATYDPTIAVALQGNRARILKEWVSTAVILAHKNVVTNRADDLKRFLRAYIEAYTVYARDPDRFDSLYNADSRLPLPSSVYRGMASYEPNLSARDISSVNIMLDASQQDALQLNADVALTIGIIKQRVDVRKSIDLHLAQEAADDIKQDRKAN